MGEEKPLDPSSTSSIPPVVAPFGAPKPAAPAPAVDAKAQLSMTINLKPIMHGPATAPKTGAIGVKPPTPVPAAPAPAPAAAAPAPAADPKAALSTTINLKPIMHTPAPAAKPASAPAAAAPAAAPGARTPTVGGLRPGLKLPPRPGTPTIRKPMPTVGGLRPGLKLPPRPGALAAKPAAPSPAPAPAPATPAAPAPVAAPSPVATQKPAPQPAQAVLRKTGIIAEGLLTPEQSVASKTKTSRIPLESAIGGGAPAAPAGAPLKTIRLRRPTALGAAPAPAAAPSPAPAPAPAPAPVPAAEVPAEPAAEAPTLKLQRPAAAPVVEPASDVTQKKTLKLQRPGAPAGLPVKKPGTIKMTKPGLSLPKPGLAKPGAPVPADGEIKEMSPEEMNEGVADLKPLSAVDLAAGPAPKLAGGVSKGACIASIITTVAALAVLGFTVFYFASQCFGPAAGANDLASFHAEQPFGPAAAH